MNEWCSTPSPLPVSGPGRLLLQGLLSECATTYVLLVDGQGALVYFNPPAGQELFGPHFSLAAGQRLRDLVHPDDYPGIEAAVFGEPQSPGPLPLPPYRVRCFLGGWRWLQG